MKTAIIHSYTETDEEYPSLLREISGNPKKIFVRGNVALLSEPAVAIVGTRKATSEARLLAKNIAREFSHKNIPVVSGLALGIDAAAHEGALLGAAKKTIAILANGLDTIYPRQHERLAEQILQNGGVLVSEHASGTPPLPHHFLERNRIISGLSLATCVIEAPAKSGSLRTAQDAMEQGREVFVFPGPAGHPHYVGSHLLIRNGARLVSSFEDITEDLSDLFDIRQKLPLSETMSHSDSPLPHNILSLLQQLGGRATLDELIMHTEKNPAEIISELTLLLIEGIIFEDGSYFCLTQR